ncbi:MAG: FAD-dependent oxidoreductase, partial [Flavobacteriia bacterium]|nr:FAD-dependent oxidoreductase [Flavobacteriia bacterium]
MKQAIVIGSGIAGLACSLRLQKKGYQVTVIEKNSYTGGKLHAIQKKGYRFDMGPSLFTMPNLVTELFELHGEDANSYFTYKKKEVVCHYFWSDGSQFKSHANPEKWIEDATVFFNENTSSLKKYLKKSALKYQITA